MKYLKTYEEAESEYKPGDYVVLDLNNKDLIHFFDTEKTFIGDKIDNVALIIGIENRETEFPYKSIFTNGYRFNVSLNEILRLATKEEIHNFEITKVIPKYNL